MTVRDEVTVLLRRLLALEATVTDETTASITAVGIQAIRDRLMFLSRLSDR